MAETDLPSADFFHHPDADLSLKSNVRWKPWKSRFCRSAIAVRVGGWDVAKLMETRVSLHIRPDLVKSIVSQYGGHDLISTTGGKQLLTSTNQSGGYSQ